MTTALAALAIALSGAGLVAVGFVPGTRRDRWLQIWIALALGVGAWSAAYATCLLLWGSDRRLLLAKDGVLSISGAWLWAAALRKAPAEVAPKPESAPRWLRIGFSIACAIAALILIDHTMRFPDGGWDASMVWNLRARFLVRSADFRTAFSPELIFWAHPEQPWLVPGAVAQGFLLTGSESPAVPALLGFAFGAVAIAILTLTLARMRGILFGLLGGLVLVTTPSFITCAANQEADVPVGVYLLVSAALVALWREAPGRPRRMLVLAGFAAGLGAWTKNEGSLYLGCLAAALLLRSGDRRATGWFLLGSLPCVALLAAFKMTAAPTSDLMRFSSSSAILLRTIDLRRWGELGLAALRRSVYFQEFALWAAAEIVVLVWLFRKAVLKAAPAVRVVGMALVLACAAYAPIYVVQPYPVFWLVKTSLDRILMQLWPAGILVTLLWLSDELRGRTLQTSK